ncbi:DNA-3-methyladenine glycosylase family protein [Methylobacterium sp. Leaf118]|uniref:DNA-3-methyladenine glycosylase family protein n=1 Tax=Methylobacterium sp. Leaf118 TaxID=2876562 RepID=UPI001E5CBA1F|nr:DNA-3-methyladenine glycosylase 2 family protein [Methylobacterium sp. Leaf118]
MRAPDIHERLLATAAAIGPPLHDALARIGPIVIAPPAHASVAERLFVEIVSQQLSTKAALAIWTRVEAAALAQGGAPRDLFVPGFEAVLRGCGVSANKARALQAVRAAEAQGLLGADLAGLPHAERSAVLCSIRGVGPWTADMVGIFHFLDPDIWPVGDVAAVGTLRRLTGCDDTVPVAARFAPFRSILARALWRSRDAAT